MIRRRKIGQAIPKIHTNYPLIDWFVPLLLLLSKLILVISDRLTNSKSQHNIILIITLPKRCLLDKWMFRILLFELGLIGILCHCGLITTDGEVTVAISVRLGKRNRLFCVLFLVLWDYSFVVLETEREMGTSQLVYLLFALYYWGHCQFYLYSDRSSKKKAVPLCYT